MGWDGTGTGVTVVVASAAVTVGLFMLTTSGVTESRTAAYTDASIEALYDIEQRYPEADAGTREDLRLVALRHAALVPPEAMPYELRVFVADLRASGGER